MAQESSNSAFKNLAVLGGVALGAVALLSYPILTVLAVGGAVGVGMVRNKEKTKEILGNTWSAVKEAVGFGWLKAKEGAKVVDKALTEQAPKQEASKDALKDVAAKPGFDTAGTKPANDVEAVAKPAPAPKPQPLVLKR